MRHVGGADGGTGAGTVLDDEASARLLGQLLRQRARQDVDAAARRTGATTVTSLAGQT